MGGDYFDVFPMSEDRTAFLIADVSGKGLGAALLTTMLQGALSGMTLGVEPAKVFSHINRFLCEHALVGRYATLFFAIVDSEGMLEFINAGHPSPLLLRGDSDRANSYNEGSFPVGLVEEAEFASMRRQLEPGDTLVLFTDGVTEAMDPDEQLFGNERLRAGRSGRQRKNDSRTAADDSRRGGGLLPGRGSCRRCNLADRSLPQTHRQGMSGGGIGGAKTAVLPM